VAAVDAVIVSYHSVVTLRACVQALLEARDVNVIVVDNHSTDGSLESVGDLPIVRVAAGRNGGFAYGANMGMSFGDAPYVLLLNPDAVIHARDVAALVDALDREPAAALAAPRIEGFDGRLAYSQRRFQRLRSTWAQALYVHRLRPRAPWVDELVRDAAAYERPGRPEWVSGACMLVRRSALERVGGLDERFFLYCEDMDLCRRLRCAGYDILFEPRATARHVGGASSADGETLPVLARSRVRYARAHHGPVAAAVTALAVAAGAATHSLAAAGRRGRRRGHARALRAALAEGFSARA
jgi:GT2 family glycosyltransferase